MSAFCLCMFTACDSDDNNLLCYGTHTDIEGDVTAFELLAMERPTVRKL